MKRDKYSLSHYKLFTGNMGTLIPLTHYEVLPGDTIQQSTSMLIRVSPLLAPLMHPVIMRIHHWFVPYDIIWDTFEDFITGGEDGLDSTTAPFHRLNADYSGHESNLIDYLGIPPIDYTGKAMDISALPLRAYASIFNQHYRDQQVVTELTVDTTDGQDSTTPTALERVSWEKDYFTTCRSDDSLGDTVSIPLTGDAEVYGIGKQNQNWASGSQAVYETGGSATYTDYRSIDLASGANNTFFVEKGGAGGSDPNIYADTSAITGVPITDLRLSLALQRYQEARNRYGARYTEYVNYLSNGLINDQDDDHPIYLGGGRATIQFSEVLDHTGAGTLGDMAGHGIGAVRTKKWRRFFNKHGLVMSLMSVIPKAIYADGIHRGYFRTTKEDYYQKELVNIGDMEVYNKELYADHTTADGVFGYQQRYDDYRSLPSNIAGEYRSTLDHWHLARLFASDPSLNSTFLDCTPAQSRVLASGSTDALYCMANHSIQARRMLPKRR